MFNTAEGIDPNYYDAMAITSEALSFVGIILLASMVEKLLKEKVEVAMDVVEMELSLHSKRKLLSVLCDAHVTLGHDFRILGRCTELSHMLMTGFGSHSKGLEGTEFTSLMTESDQQRFLDLLAVGAMPDSGLENDDGKTNETSQSSQSSRVASSRLKWLAAPAKSIQVHIRDAAGVRFPIELFHIFLPNMHNPSAPPGHLIGIREEPGGHEISTSFQQLGSISEVAPAGRAAAVVTSAGATPRPAEPLTRVLSDLRPKKSSGSRASQASSGSEVPPPAAVRLDPADLPSIHQIEFQFDGMADGFPLQEARIFFDSRAATESSACAIMNDWLMESIRPRFREWVQHTINEGMAGRGDTFTPPRVQWNSCGQDGQTWCSVPMKSNFVWKCWQIQHKRRKQTKKDTQKMMRACPFWRPCEDSISTRSTRTNEAVRLSSRRGRLQHSLQSKSMTGGCSGLLHFVPG
ncbi:unnamed protein product [Polarella glacialis]|uniref:Uncharacterized protein n=1 Tax=Polarella glacialis TaxID=89957 RepID=A0A813JYM8_POLGL|nr:unnamed protein product [Polarella glacialis]